MHHVDRSHHDDAPDMLVGANVMGGVVIGGVLSLMIWAGIIGVFIL